MTDLNNNREYLSADVLIIGGGIGGLASAIKVKEKNPGCDVLIVEKQTVGWAGKATKIGGILAFLGPNNDADKFIDFQLHTSGLFLNDQELLAKYVKDTYGAIQQFSEWGNKLAKTPDGNMLSFPAMFAPEYSSTFIDIDLMLPMRTKAKKMGTRIIDKVHIVDLLTLDNRVVGAAGFNIVDGHFIVINTKATILANGSCGYKVRRFWSAGTGDGIAAAYRAGAEMRNAEYGNLYGHTVFQATDSGMVGSDFLVNNLGENLAQKYMPDRGPAGVFLPVKLAVGLEKEVAEGRGPIYFEPPKAMPPHGFSTGLPKIEEWLKKIGNKEKEHGISRDSKPEIAVPLHGETSCIKVDHDMKTSLDGLWAIGDTSYAGSALAGAVASPPGVCPGSGIMFAVISAGWAGASVADYVSAASPVDLKNIDTDKIRDNMFAPMKDDHNFSPWVAISVLGSIAAPMKYNLRRSEERLSEAISMIEKLKEKLPDLNAKDPHYLGKCHEVKSMTLCAELTFRAALMRTESRGFHYREDFPAQDDKNWLKWIIIKQDKEEMKLSTQPVPVNDYKIRPDGK
ncbi:MAG: FAD-binding protein [Desulfatiglans sp.]|jgi:succinate dehydrogenase/fumarate reductase flavoprotein subunit|nr:FAD-binding protein [Desulfatiglans sp.]